MRRRAVGLGELRTGERTPIQSAAYTTKVITRHGFQIEKVGLCRERRLHEDVRPLSSQYKVAIRRHSRINMNGYGRPVPIENSGLVRVFHSTHCHRDLSTLCYREKVVNGECLMRCHCGHIQWLETAYV